MEQHSLALQYDEDVSLAPKKYSVTKMGPPPFHYKQCMHAQLAIGKHTRKLMTWCRIRHPNVSFLASKTDLPLLLGNIPYI